jgi:uncharacterized protein
MKYFINYGILLTWIISFNSCVSFRLSDKKTIDKFGQLAAGDVVKYYDFKGVSTRYLHFNHDNVSMPLLVLIHGAPGSSSALIDFVKQPMIKDNYSIVLIDRLGYGFSDYGHYASIMDQSQFVISLIDSIVGDNQKVFIAGHSYGGTIVASIASMHPDFLTASAMMAPALDSQNEKYFWFSKLGKWKATRWMASKALKVATNEKYNHAHELTEWQSKWDNIVTPILHIHGDKDNVVPFVNLAFAQSEFPTDYLTAYRWEGTNHFFPFKATEKCVFILHNYFQKY